VTGKVKVMASIACLEPIISKTAGDTRSVMTSRDPKYQARPHIYLDGNILKSVEIALDRLHVL